jgi:hypothetical protein
MIFMALTYAQLDTLSQNATFLGRVRSAISQYAAFWIGNAGATQQQKDWATNAFYSGRLATIASNIMHQLTQDPAVTGSTTGDGSDITDANLQNAVNAIVLNYR